MALRVLHCIPSGVGGGAEKQIGYLAPALAEQGCEAAIAMLRPGPLNPAGVPIFRLPYRSHKDPLILWHLVRRIQAYQPDIIQTWMPMMDIFGALAGQLAGVPVVTSERNSSKYYARTPRNQARKWIIRYVARAVVANSEGGLAYWRPTLPPHTITRVIRNIVPVEALAAARPVPLPAYTDIPEPRMILVAGRFVAGKNYDTIFPALKAIVQAHDDVIALVAGDGPARPAWEAWVQQHNLAHRIHLVGFVDNLPALMQAAAAFLSLSWVEGQPNTVLEAMACGCPLVVSDIPEHREFLTDSAAYFAPPGDVATVVSQLRAALTDPETAQAMANVARSLVAGHTAATIAAQYIEVYRQASR